MYIWKAQICFPVLAEGSVVLSFEGEELGRDDVE